MSATLAFGKRTLRVPAMAHSVLIPSFVNHLLATTTTVDEKPMKSAPSSIATATRIIETFPSVSQAKPARSQRLVDYRMLGGKSSLGMKLRLTGFTQLCTALLFLCATMAAHMMAAESKPPLTNSSVIKMLKAELAADTIVLAIEASPGNYDTSTDALIELKNSGADEKVLNAMLRKNSGSSTVAQSPTGNAPSPESFPVSPQGIPTRPSPIGGAWLIDGTNRIQMKATVNRLEVKRRTNWNPIGPSTLWDSLQQYPGARAALRLQNNKPSFEFGVPNNVQVNQHVQLSVLKVIKKNDYRELRVEKGTAFGSGQLKESMIPINLEEVKTDEIYGAKFVTYRATPENALKPGEYVFQISGGEYDFGVD